MAENTNTERAKFEAWYKTTQRIAKDLFRDGDGYMSNIADSCWDAWQARASLSLPAAGQEPVATINGQLYAALGNLFSYLGAEGCVTSDHSFVWDAMTALKRIDGGIHLDDLAVPVEPDAHRDDMLAAVQLLEDGEWAEHFAKTPIGMRLEDQITKLHSELNEATSAAPQPAVAAGWVMVPAEPTLEMRNAGFNSTCSHAFMACYRAMLKAAPLPPAPSTEGEGNG